MRLTTRATKASNNTRTRINIAIALGCTEGSVIRYLTQNKNNGPLTTAAALKVIKQETGLKESEILTEVETEVGAAKLSA